MRLNATPLRESFPASFRAYSSSMTTISYMRERTGYHKKVTGHQRHLVQISHVPGADDDAAAVRGGLELLDDFADLVDVAAIGLGPAAPLHAVHGAKAAVRARPFVPDGAAALLQPFHIAVAAQEPQQFIDDGFEVHFLGGHQRKTFGQVKAHLVAKHAAGAGAGAVTLAHTMLVHMAHKVFVLRTNWAVCCCH